jgi:hypothetical protein
VDIHPLAKYEIAQMRNAEKLARSLAAYDALRAREEQPAERDVVQTSVGRLRFVGRLRWRGAGARGPSRPAI